MPLSRVIINTLVAHIFLRKGNKVMVKKVVLAGGGVLGVQIALMCAYTGHDTTFWLRSEGSIGRTQPKIDHYSKAILGDLEYSRKLIGSPMAAYL